MAKVKLAPEMFLPVSAQGRGFVDALARKVSYALDQAPSLRAIDAQRIAGAVAKVDKWVSPKAVVIGGLKAIIATALDAISTGDVAGAQAALNAALDAQRARDKARADKPKVDKVKVDKVKVNAKGGRKG